MRPTARRRDVENIRQTLGTSERRAYTILCVDRSSMRYAYRRGDDGHLRSRLMEIALERPRAGCRRLGIILAREGIVIPSEIHSGSRAHRWRQATTQRFARFSAKRSKRRGVSLFLRPEPARSSRLTGTAMHPRRIIAAAKSAARGRSGCNDLMRPFAGDPR